MIKNYKNLDLEKFLEIVCFSLLVELDVIKEECYFCYSGKKII